MNKTKYKVTKKSELAALAASIRTGKTSLLVAGGWDQNYASGVVVIDHVIGKAEIHDKMRDVWYILSGQARFKLGGKMINPKSSKPGEWAAEALRHPEIVEVSVGDVIDIPPGTPHQIDALEERIEAFLIKVPA